MTTRARHALDLSGIRTFGASASPPPHPGAGPAALAVAVALLRALRERGLLSADDLDDVLADALGQVGPAARQLLQTVRGELERTKTEETA